MGKAKSAAIRHKVVEMYELGHTLRDIATEQGMSYTSVQTLCARYKKLGAGGIKPQYVNCGRQYPTSSNFVYRCVRCLRTWHPSWGAGKIRAEIVASRPNLIIPPVRTLHDWLVHNKQTHQRDKQPKERKEWGKSAHEVWQIDAKEAMKTLDGQYNCWLNIKDEYTGAVIDPPVFPL